MCTQNKQARLLRTYHNAKYYSLNAKPKSIITGLSQNFTHGWKEDLLAVQENRSL